MKPSNGDPDEGMVLDFAQLKLAWGKLHAQLDHQNLNDVLPVSPTTAENIALYLLEQLRAVVPQVNSVTVWETPDCWARVSHEGG